MANSVFGLDKHGPVSPHVLLVTLNSLVGAYPKTVLDVYIVTLAIKLALRDRDAGNSIWESEIYKAIAAHLDPSPLPWIKVLLQYSC